MLKIGRVGAVVELGDPEMWDFEAGESRLETISGEMYADTLEDATALQTEMLAQVNQMVAVVFDEMPDWNGFYWLRDATVRAESWSLFAKTFNFSVAIERIGAESRALFQSLLMHLPVANMFGVTALEATWWHAGPGGTVAYNIGNIGTPFSHVRTIEGGFIIPFYSGLPGGVDPTWSCEPSRFYEGAVTIKTDGYVRTGIDIPFNHPGDWEVSNGLTRVRPGVSTGTQSNGHIIVEHWTSTEWRGDTYRVLFEDSTASEVDEWDFFNVAVNTPEVCVVTLTRDAREAPASTHQHLLDITLRRGSISASFFYNWTGADTTWSIGLSATTASSTFTPAAATGPPGIRRTSADSFGNRYVLATALAHTNDTTNGRLVFANVDRFDFMIGKEIAGMTDTLDLASSSYLHYIGWTEEFVTTVMR